MALCGCDRIADIDASLLQGQAGIDTAPAREAVHLVN